MLVVSEAMSRRRGAVVDDDVLFKFRLRLFSLAAELGNVREACRLMDVHPSTYYRWRGPVLRSGLEMLQAPGAAAAPDAEPGEPARRGPGRRLQPGPPGPGTPADQRDAGPGALGRDHAQPQRRLADPAPPRPLPADQPPQSRRRLCRAARARAPDPPAAHHVEVDHPGELVGFDCFHVGRLSGTAGRVWQYTAIDLASSYVWAELATTPLNPSARKTSTLARRVAADLAARGWRLERVLTDNGSEFRSSEFGATVAALGARQTFIRPGRPTTNGAVERVQRTILEECWRPSFARSLVPKMGGLVRDLAGYVRFYNEERAHTGRLTRGQTPLQALIGARKMRPR